MIPNGPIYLALGIGAAFINVPLLIFTFLKNDLRTKYPTVAGQLLVDFLCICFLITSGLMFLQWTSCRTAYVVISAVPILQSVYTLITTIDYLVARFQPLFFHSPPFLYRFTLFTSGFITSTLLFFVCFENEDFSCPDASESTLDGFLFLYSSCIILNFASLICLLILFFNLTDLQFKFAITIKFTVILSLILIPFLIVLVLYFFDNKKLVHFGIDISASFIAVGIIINSVLQLRNKHLSKEARSFITGSV